MNLSECVEGAERGALVGYSANYERPTHKARLVQRRDELKKKLEKQEEALAALESNPEIERVLEAVMAAEYY